MRRTLLVVTLAIVTAAMIALASPALAIGDPAGDPPPQADKGIRTAKCAGLDHTPPIPESDPTFCTN